MYNFPPDQSGNPQPALERVPVSIRLPAQNAFVSYSIIGLTLLVYGVQSLSQNLSSGGYDWPLLLGAKINDLILAGELWRLITPVFLHGSILHIAFNMYALYSIGPSLERHYGHWKFLLLYFICAFTGNTLSFLLSDSTSVGASTAVFGLVAAEVVFIYRNRSLFGPRARPMLINLLLIVVVNLFIGLQPGIDNWGHLGGLFGGAVFAWVAGPIMKVQATPTGYELLDSRTRAELLWGVLLSAGLFVAAVIGRMLVG